VPLQDAQQVGDDPLGVVMSQLAGVMGESPRSREIAPEGAATGEVEVVSCTTCLPRPGERHAHRWLGLGVAQRPQTLELLSGEVLDPLEAVGQQDVDVDGEHPPQLVEQDAADLLALRGGGSVQRGMGARPARVVPRDLVHVDVVDDEQPGLLEVRHRHAPAALEVEVEPIRDDRT
jgi:hypothetical protein